MEASSNLFEDDDFSDDDAGGAQPKTPGGHTYSQMNANFLAMKWYDRIQTNYQPFTKEEKKEEKK